MDIPSDLADAIRRRMETTGRVTEDGKALRVCGSIGYECCISPEGDVYMLTDPTVDADCPWLIDRSRHAQLCVLLSGGKYFPELLALLPNRPPNVPDCPDCRAGWVHIASGHKFICGRCGGLGWIERPFSGYRPFRDFGPGQVVVLPTDAPIDVGKITRAIVFVVATWSVPSRISCQALETALSQLPSLGDIVLYLANTESEATIEFIRANGSFPSGAGETYWILRGAVLGKMHAYREQDIPELIRRTEQLLNAAETKASGPQ
ncbi:MAG: hypothetical protein JSS02_00850 [Planctomycetes bacterium]|nr:hypothetical protein [Planctomycetota bacterium]